MDDQILAGVNRLRALLGWWGLSGNADGDDIARRLTNFHNFVAATQKAYMDAAGRHMDAIFVSNNRLARSAHELLTGKQSELSAAQAAIVSIVLEAATLHARTWAEFQREVEGLYSASTRTGVEKPADPPKPFTQSKDDRRSGTPASETLVDAA